MPVTVPFGATDGVGKDVSRLLLIKISLTSESPSKMFSGKVASWF